MALVDCPECGKSNISDTAIQCPECGYAVSDHFAREKRKQEVQLAQKALEEKTEEERRKLQFALEIELKKVDELPYPEKPSLFKIMFTGEGSSLMYWAIAIFIVSALWGAFTDSTFLMFIAALDLIVGIPILLFIYYSDYTMFMGYYERDTKDWEKTKERKKDVIRKEFENRANNMARYGTYSKPAYDFVPEKNVAKCPICGSTKIKKIGIAKKVVSISAVGLASNDIGNQMKCENCGYKF